MRFSFLPGGSPAAVIVKARAPTRCPERGATEKPVCVMDHETATLVWIYIHPDLGKHPSSTQAWNLFNLGWRVLCTDCVFDCRHTRGEAFARLHVDPPADLCTTAAE